ncbi:5117_t:CDS:2, partial [Gigaspora rosea]
QRYEVSESFDDEYSDSDEESLLASPSQFYQEHESNKNNDNAQIEPSTTNTRPICDNCAGTNSSTKHREKQSSNKLKKI